VPESALQKRPGGQSRKANLGKKSMAVFKKTTGRKPMSAAMRKRLSAMMKARWAARKKAA
jgi:hypothetical protein